MKKLILAASILSMTGCATMVPLLPHVELAPKKVNSSANPEELYNAAQQCVLDNVTAPLTGQLFTFQSEKNNSIAFVYSDRQNFESYGAVYNFPFRATVRFDGKTGIFKPQSVTNKWGDRNANANSGNNGIDNYYTNATVKVNNMVQRLADCVPTYL
ncbi:hypothetical protein [Moritella sp. Urea-trap-13]|uniref:hypothetical protein n=1 Tax=Moritella sp. Urea-trap-13 TaxID=2058327 RepID=UPI000C33BF60|nr:hypothetical protein [Moritella sp. Urea-trap-13]PKH04958.1 hypothetical protein CXF93_19320 [Moritella sp. Urea-trap-13]